MREKIQIYKHDEVGKGYFSYNRSLSGDGVRKTIKYIQKNVNKNLNQKT